MKKMLLAEGYKSEEAAVKGLSWMMDNHPKTFLEKEITVKATVVENEIRLIIGTEDDGGPFSLSHLLRDLYDAEEMT